MEENQKGVDGELEKLAMITDALETLFPNGQTVIVIELEENDFKTIQKNFRDVDRNYKRFKIDISNVEIVFIQSGFNFEEPKEEKSEKPKEEKKIGVFKRIFRNLFSGKISS